MRRTEQVQGLRLMKFYHRAECLTHVGDSQRSDL